VSGLALAWQFLTVLPWPVRTTPDERAFGWAQAFFPLVGTAIGLLMAAVELAARLALPEPVGVILALAAGLYLTGGLHADGLADTCDGVFCHAPPERRLEIMRDSRIGSFGAAGLTLDLLLKYALLATLPPLLRSAGFIAAPAAGRWAMVVATWAFPYARPEGLGRRFKESVRWPVLLVATLLAVLIAGTAARLAGLAALGLALAAAFGAGAFFMHRLPGLTGDCYGAINEVAEVGFLLTLSALATGSPR
jgi:adenosylcobinamide-GDP ribazoletransferase